MNVFLQFSGKKIYDFYFMDEVNTETGDEFHKLFFGNFPADDEIHSYLKLLVA